MINFDITPKGPLFNRGQSSEEIDRFIRDGAKAIGDAAVKLSRLKFRAKIQVYTGRFTGRISAIITGSLINVDSRNILYGRWLEGIGSRNATTRFKGYHGFRDTRIIIDRNTKDILQPLMDKMIRELGGS
jgi:hypothetical protein